MPTTPMECVVLPAVLAYATVKNAAVDGEAHCQDETVSLLGHSGHFAVPPGHRFATFYIRWFAKRGGSSIIALVSSRYDV